MAEESVLSESKILILDDQEGDAILMRRILEISGFANIEWQPTVGGAFESMDRLLPDLVILDLHLNGTNGLDVLSQLRERFGSAGEVPVLICTGDTEIESKRSALTLGATDFLTKPVDMIEVGKRVRNLIETLHRRQDLEQRVRERTQDLQKLNDELEIEVSGRKKVEAALRHSEQRLRFLLESCWVMVYSCEPSPPFTHTYLSPNVLDHLGYEPDDFISEPSFWISKVHPDDRAMVSRAMKESLEGTHVVQEYRVKHKDGSYRWINDDLKVVRDAQGQPIEIVGGWIEVTDRVEAQEAVAGHAKMLEEANARLQEFDRLKSEFVATASHEMRTPLTVIREFASQLSDGLAGEVGGEQREMLDAMIRNCDRLRALLDNLLNLHKIEAEKMEINRRKTDLSKSLRDCYRDFSATCRSKGIELFLEMDEDLPAVFCDVDSIHQVVVNLIGNAVKFTPRAGKITISAKGAGNNLKISVADTGRGIAPKDLAKVFDAFTQIDRLDGPGNRGTGLGLTISKKIVEMHGSTIEVTSAVDRGSTFSFSLPIWNPEAELSAFINERWMSAHNGKGPETLMVLRSSADKEETESGLLAQVMGRIAVTCPTAPGSLRLASSSLVAAVLDTDVRTAEHTLQLLASGDETLSHASIESSIVGYSGSKQLEEWLEDIERSFKPLDGR